MMRGSARLKLYGPDGVKKKGMLSNIWYILWYDQTRKKFREKSTGCSDREMAEAEIDRFCLQNDKAKRSSYTERRHVELGISLREMLSGYEREHWTPSGYADLVSPTEVVEIKSAQKWQEGLGQLLSYAHYLPGRQPTLHLFGYMSEVSKLACENVCAGLGVTVTYEDQVENAAEIGRIAVARSRAPETNFVTFQANPAPQASANAVNTPVAPQRDVNAGETDGE